MSKSRKKQPITYTYLSLEGPPITITAGQDGVTQADITLLRDFDRSTHLNERYEKENKDPLTERKKIQHAKEPEQYSDPIGDLAEGAFDLIEIIEPDEKSDNALLEQLAEFMKLLTPQQLDLIYEIFGTKKQLAEIAKEQGVTKTAIHNRKTKIIARLTKLFKGNGIT